MQVSDVRARWSLVRSSTTAARTSEDGKAIALATSRPQLERMRQAGLAVSRMRTRVRSASMTLPASVEPDWHGPSGRRYPRRPARHWWPTTVAIGLKRLRRGVQEDHRRLVTRPCADDFGTGAFRRLTAKKAPRRKTPICLIDSGGDEVYSVWRTWVMDPRASGSRNQPRRGDGLPVAASPTIAAASPRGKVDRRAFVRGTARAASPLRVRKVNAEIGDPHGSVSHWPDLDDDAQRPRPSA